MQLYHGCTTPNIIAHRGNIHGPNQDKENHPTYIEVALREGYGVEIDVWYENGLWALGHDKPQYQIDVNYLFNISTRNGAFGNMYRHHPRVWIHLKNLAAVTEMDNMNHYNSITSCKEENVSRKISDRLNYFWHQNDDITLTNHHHVWVHPNTKVIPIRSAWVVPEMKTHEVYDYANPNWLRAKWVCVDFAKKVTEKYNSFRTSNSL